MKVVSNLSGLELDTIVELEVFGDDLSCAFDERRIPQACDLFVPKYQDGPRNLVIDGTRYPPEDWVRLCGGPGYDFWHYREGKPWQKDLEAVIEAYRTDPRAFHRDLNLCFRHLVPNIPNFRLSRHTDCWKACWISERDSPDSRFGVTPEEAICRAAIVAKGEVCTTP